MTHTVDRTVNQTQVFSSNFFLPNQYWANQSEVKFAFITVREIFLSFKSFAPWCPACQHVAPVWRKLALKADALGFNVGEVDTTKEPGNVLV